MEELLRTNNAVLLSFAEAVLREAGLRAHIFDHHMSVVEGSLGVLPRRLMVRSGEAEAARRLLRDAGIADELLPPSPR